MDALKDNGNFEQAPHRRLSVRALTEILAQPSHIYFVYSAGLVKIGYSTNWRQRVDTVCQGCPEGAQLVMVMPGDRRTEAGCHALFADYRENGEWFRCEGKMREFLMVYATPEGQEILELENTQ